ncbi:hypothetical protein D6_0038 [Aeromonas phage D6]|uniref:Uncharacterized protein n=1 Tax=Aeromonas phage D6 TaxID=2593322 RepID=A0A514TVZ8_9CAUD|nr:hypothetical protein PQC08_gp237 [Aeromonas phage D6]QDJ97198.1 hypothetical protein D6_0038 [Aeromonas phage D6]
MSCSPAPIIDFTAFYPEIEKAIDKNSVYAKGLVKEEHKLFLVPELVTWLLGRTSSFIVKGYFPDPRLRNFFDHDVLIEEFDDLFLEFRDYLRLTYGLVEGTPITFLRYDNVHTFIPLKGVKDDALNYDQCDTFGQSSFSMVPQYGNVQPPSY